MQSIIRLTFFSLVLFGLSACGGGDSKSSPSPSPAPSSSAASSSSTPLLVTQNFAFSQVGPFNLLAGDVLTNQAIGEGSGTVTYLSSNPAVATVNASGLVRVIGGGSTIITATKAADNTFSSATASYTIRAISVAQTFSFEQSGLIHLSAGDTLANPATGQGSGLVTYISSNPEVATVDSNGLVTVVVVGVGETTITATKAADAHYFGASASYTLYATGVSQTISFSQPGPFSVSKGASLNNPAIGQASTPVIYNSSNTSIAMVDASGQVTVVGSGSATITATKAADNRYLSSSASYVINSQDVALAIAGPINGFVGGYTLNPVTSQGSGALTYTSSNPNIANVNSDGLVALLNEGSAVITVSKAADANYLAATSSYIVNVARSNQSITFGQAGSVTLSIGDTFSNQATAQGTGALTYSSSNTAIANVDSSGLVTVTGAGIAVITATVAADTRYLSANTSYSINTQIPFTAWIGANDTLINLPAIANGLELYSSSDSGCDFTHYLSCNNGQMNLLTGSVTTDSAARLDRLGYYVLKNANQQTLKLKVDASDALKNGYRLAQKVRSDSGITVFKNKIWLVGGYEENPIYSQRAKNDIWSSTDGINWTQEVVNTPFARRSQMHLLTMNNKLWLLGGTSEIGTPRNDVWSSDDGINWEMQTAYIGAIHLSTTNPVVTFNNRIWTIGSSSNGFDHKNEIWSTIDGINWTRATANAPFAIRKGQAVVVYHNKLWVIGGMGTDLSGNTPIGATALSEVWSSTDGITWVRESASNVPPRAYGTVVEYQNKLWLIGGSTDPFKHMNDIWSSADGITWTEEILNAPFAPRSYHNTLAYNNQLLLLNGVNAAGISPGVWSSANAIEWRLGYLGSFNFATP